MRTSSRLLAFILGAACAPACLAQTSTTLNCDRSYGFRTDANGQTGATLCDSKSDKFIDALNNFNLSNPAYTQTSSAVVLGRFSDVNIVLSYPANNSTLSYNFVELGEKGSFNGGSRSTSQQLFSDFVKKSDIIGRIMRYQADHSATSAITGIGGLIPMAGAADFSTSFDTLSKLATPDSAGSNNLIGVGLSYGNYSVSNSADKVKTTSIPLSYTVRNDIDPRRQLLMSLPLTLVQTGDANSVHGGLGVAYRLPMSDNWTLTPGGKYGVVASKDRATLSTVMAANLMSTYAIPMDTYAVAIGNMIGYYKTGKFSSGDYAFDPDIALTMARNGVMASMPAAMFGPKMAAEFSFIDTRYLGNKPFLSSTQEFGVTVGTNRNAGNARSFFRAGLSYLRGKDTRGVSANLGYWF
ncbi:MAG: hypothetical protein V4508_26135 [Pseudomonadota bacterium]